jgi:hypothetical protein
MKRVILFVFLASLFIRCENDSIGDCSIPATIRDLTGLDGCGFVLELANGSRLEPERPFIFCGTPPLPKEITEDPLYNFEFVDGKRVRISYYETNRPSICMVGPTVKITCIEEVTEFPEE